MYRLKEVSKGRFDDRGYSNEESIANLMLDKPEVLSQVLTYTYGFDDDRFPLTFLTEGQGKSGVKDVKKIQWTWKTMGRMKFDDYVVYFNTSNTTPGINGTAFEVEFATHWLIEQYGLIAPDGSQVRIMKDLGAGSHGGYLYRLKITSPNPNRYIDPENLTKGKYWSMTAPTISESFSKGNRSNSMGPGEMTSQLEFHRYSKVIAGNISNTVVEYEFKTKDGGTTNRWINEELRQFDVQVRIMDEERLWYAQYNRTESGEIAMTDEDNNQPIPHTSGMIEICDESNYITYGEVLTLNFIERSIGDLLEKDTDSGSMDVVLFGGKGFMEDFELAIRNDARAEGFATPLGDKMINEEGGNLVYGKYFRKYRTVDGHTITVKHLPFLDEGTRAEAMKKNGMIHPRTGRPLSSHEAFMIDFSSYEGNRNVVKTRLIGQTYLTGVYKGLTPIPPQWGVPEYKYLSSKTDESGYEIKHSYGLQVFNNRKMAHFKCVL